MVSFDDKMTKLLRNKRYRVLLASGLSLLAVGLVFLLANPTPTATQPIADSLEPSETTYVVEEEFTFHLSDTETERGNLDIEFLLLDLSVCGPCQGTEGILDQAVSEVTPILEGSGFDITVRKIHVESEEQARDLGFISSPTIRINGRDVQPNISEKPCDCCGDICGGTEVSCRVWVYRGEEYWAPPKAMIIDAILSEAYGGSEEVVDSTPQPADVPENLKRFFTGKEEVESKSSVICCDPSELSRCCPP